MASGMVAILMTYSDINRIQIPPEGSHFLKEKHHCNLLSISAGR